MKKQNKSIREPYDPEKTPQPPQIIDPDNRQKKENPVENPPGDAARNENGKTAAPSEHQQDLLSEDADTNDESTI